MALEIKLNQKLSQSLVMTPQLQQAIKLLQLGRMEYLEVIERELLENPVLEELPSEEDHHASGNSEQQRRENEAEQRAANTERERADAQLPNGEDSSYWNSSGGGSGARGEGDGERPSIEATLTNPAGLTSHLLWQLRTSDLGPEDQDIAAHIIGNLDKNGYLCVPLEELAALTGREAEDIEPVLSLVQSLDPPGIAARDLRECLLVQLDQLGSTSSIAWKIVRDHLGELELRKYDSIAKSLSISVEEVYEAVREIQRLEPRPGRPFVDESPVYVTPDVYVRKVGEDYVVTLNDNGIPRLRLNPVYQELLQAGRGRDASEREYLQDRVRSAAWLMKSIHQRQQTILKVTQSIVKFQRDFLEHGVGALHPLVLRDVAEDVGMHESTVSRVTTSKYVHTPQGVYELKFFFTSGLRSEDGTEVSSESVKDRIRDLITKEDPKKPLSDQQLVAMLRSEGIDIARRTVAKYREMMNVLSSSRRKKLF